MKNLKTLFVMAVLLNAGLTSVHALFGTDGKIVTPISSGSDSAHCVIQCPDGKLVIAGASSNTSNSDIALVCYNQDGSLDTSFGSNGKVITDFWGNEQATSLVRQPDGKLVVCGLGETGGTIDFALVRYNSNGSLDTGFGTNGRAMVDIAGQNDLAYSMIEQPDGKLVIGGTYIWGSNLFDFAAARFNSNGSLDTTFDGDGKVTTVLGTLYDFGLSLIQQTDGKLVLGGYYKNAGTTYYEAALVRYNSNGSLDTGFGANGIVHTSVGSYDDQGYCVIQQRNGKLVLAGYSDNGTDTDILLLRYNSNGSPDTGFGSNGHVTLDIYNQTDRATSLIEQKDGKLVAAGYSGTDLAMVRYSADGVLDNTFGLNGKVVTDLGGNNESIECVREQYDGKLVAVGYTNYSGSSDFFIVRYNRDGTLDTQVDPPQLTDLKITHGLAGQTLTLLGGGWDLRDVVAAKLRNGPLSINATNLAMSDTSLAAQLVLPQTSGLYHLYLAKSSANVTCANRFTVYHSLAAPLTWQVNDLGKPGNAISGTAGIVVGDLDQDNRAEVIVASNSDRIFVYRKAPDWGYSYLPPESAGVFEDVVLADLDLDGVQEVYGATSYPRIIQYQWSVDHWTSQIISSMHGPLTVASLAGGGLVQLNAVSGNSAGQVWRYNNNWIEHTLGSGTSAMVGLWSGDGDDNGANELYAANEDHALYELDYQNPALTWKKTVFSGSATISTLVVADADQDGSKELYIANQDGYVNQLKWNGAAWNSQAINSSAVVVNKLVYSDADNDGVDELYGAAQDGHVYQFIWGNGSWSMVDLAQTPSALKAMAIGDGDNDGYLELYALGADGHVYQIQAAGFIPTPTPVASGDFDGQLISEKYTYCAPNPSRGEIMNYVVYTAQACEVELKMYTSTHRFVQSFNLHCPGPGKYEHRFYVGNLANGVYLMLVKAEGNGRKEKVVKKVALIK